VQTNQLGQTFLRQPGLKPRCANVLSDHPEHLTLDHAAWSNAAGFVDIDSAPT
jgi:hypothetical protein